MRSGLFPIAIYGFDLNIYMIENDRQVEYILNVILKKNG
jgi:hypothetical protein